VFVFVCAVVVDVLCSGQDAAQQRDLVLLLLETALQIVWIVLGRVFGPSLRRHGPKAHRSSLRVQRRRDGRTGCTRQQLRMGRGKGGKEDGGRTSVRVERVKTERIRVFIAPNMMRKLRPARG